MTAFKVAVLGILHQASEPLGWYAIERQLSNMSIDERENLPEALDELERVGLVSRVDAGGTSKLRHEITIAGAAWLAAAGRDRPVG